MTVATKPTGSSDQDLAKAVRLGEEGSWPAVLLSRRIKPLTIDELIDAVCPSGKPTAAIFDTIADGFAIYQRQAEAD